MGVRLVGLALCCVFGSVYVPGPQPGMLKALTWRGRRFFVAHALLGVMGGGGKMALRGLFC
jgi:hypothetical protein